jgi:hypothetical protein
VKVRELIKWLQAFEDQDADVAVVEHSSGSNVYEQGGSVVQAEFDPAVHVEYSDMRGNQFVPPSAPYADKRTLLLGAFNL